MINLHLEQNGVCLHVVNRKYLAAKYPAYDPDEMFYNVSDEKNKSTNIYVTNRLTFGDMATCVLGNASFDYALPQEFYNSIPTWRQCVWLYDEHAPIFGRPFNVVAAFNQFILDQCRMVYYK